MKTKILILATLLLGGLIFTSCQKDNSLYEETAMVKDSPWDDPNEWGDINGKLANFPDPFTTTTTIVYKLENASRVRLAVYNKKGELVANLFEGIQEAGEHLVKFDATHLPVGEYQGMLTVNQDKFYDTMTKVSIIQIKHNNPVDID